MRDKSVKLAAIATDTNIVVNEVVAHLQGILYHNLAKVQVLYKIAFGIQMWPDDETKVRLHQAVVLRHDCVHRNGTTKEGLPIQFTAEEVGGYLDTMLKFVEHVAKKISESKAETLAG